MQKLNRLISIINWISEQSKIASFLIVAMIVILVAETIGRYAFNSPTQWGHETSQMLFGGFFMLGGAYVLRYRAHVNIDILQNRLSPRGKAIMDLITSPLLFITCGILIWTGGELFLASLVRMEHSTSTWSPPLYPLRFVIPLAGALIALQGLAKFIEDLRIAIKGKDTK